MQGKRRQAARSPYAGARPDALPAALLFDWRSPILRARQTRWPGSDYLIIKDMATQKRSVPESSGGGFKPFIPPEATLREFTPRALILGTLLGMIFGASSLYLVLKVGLTVSASIPVAVISLALFRLWSKAGGRDASILENNIVQTAGSAGESLAFGLGVTMPAILILGFDLEI